MQPVTWPAMEAVRLIAEKGEEGRGQQGEGRGQQRGGGACGKRGGTNCGIQPNRG